MSRRRLVRFGTHYAPGRRLCRRCRARYTALGICPDCQRLDLRRGVLAYPGQVVTRSRRRAS